MYSINASVSFFGSLKFFDVVLFIILWSVFLSKFKELCIFFATSLKIKSNQNIFVIAYVTENSKTIINQCIHAP